ncbi:MULTISPECIES: DUF6527 family protein [unclassified Bradyrhizobium]|uniref:DUF6527 family protein n=1 Tax=unclassified Bradyrhizobium TaxID=2631580 RepID=UPI001FF89917|nr:MULTISPECIES: DUF6527 family protein [unclassified Bradyrhizobium]MCK1298466.1 hypothetical protein [Bradyrhizobium sp. 37]MCK1769510.1 hypothetical protein [Bradyrhizobium sp. 134]
MILRWLRRAFDRYGPRRGLEIVEGDSLPARLPRRDLVLAREGEEDWCVGMRCPCGCGQGIELLLVEEAKPRWDLSVDSSEFPSLKPSVWLQTGCKSHFWLRRGRVEWCG